jgi:glycosyltransferase involved in cell wall biosynthesis
VTRSSSADAPGVVVSLQGRFHGFDLARELHAQGLLQRLWASQPVSRVAQWGVPREKIRSMMRYEALSRAATLLRVERRIPNLFRFVYDQFDRAIARRIEPADLVVAWAGMALHTLRRARAQGARTVVERGSAHIAYQCEIIDDELRRWGIPGKGTADPWMLEKELLEYEEADAIGIASDFVRRSFAARGVPESKLIQVPYGVDLRAFSPGPRVRPGFRAIYAGALSLRKGIPDLLHAVRRASVELWLLGARSAEVEPFLRDFAANHVWHGTVPQARLTDYYRDADVFVIASLEDGYAMVVPQALACGLPVICTENTGAAELIEQGVNGFVVPIRDPDAIARCLCALRDDPARLAEMKRAAASSLGEGGSWQEYGRRVAGHYRQLIAQNGSARRAAR